MATHAFDPHGLAGNALQSARRYVNSDLRRDGAAIATTLVAWSASVQWPSISYLLLVTAFAINIWYLGRSRALALTLGVLVVVAAFLAPSVGRVLLVRVFKDVPHFALFVIVLALVGSATEALKRARAAAEEHVAALNKANADLAHQMEEVRSLSEDLSQSNDALEDALIEAERTAARATALQEVTAALSMANATSDIATVLLTLGLRAMQATRGHLMLIDGDRIVSVIGVDGSPSDTELALRYSSGDETLPLVRAIRDKQTVWLRSATEYEVCFPKGSDAPGAMDIDAHLALALIHAGEVVGGLTFDFAICPAILATDNLFTTLLAQAAADALVRARSYDQEREARRNAELLSRAREDVLGVVAHDLRNPLNLVSMTSQLLMEPDLAPERRQSTYAINVRAVNRMNRLIGDLLDVVRMEAGHLSLNVGPCDVSRLLEETVESFQQRAAEQGIALVSNTGTNATIQADGERILQLIDNLVGNALKFTPSGGQVSLGAEVEGDEVRITIADTGPGIPEEQLARLFDRFWQARGNDRRGLGLGLPIAKGIAEAHGGRLWVESSVGSGTAFRFAMPISGRSP
jgi:signal transduction histidine kinase